MKRILIGMLGVVTCFACNALEIGPLVHEIEVDSTRKSTKILVSNNSANEKLIDTEVLELTFNSEGYSVRSLEKEKIIVSPPAFKLAPGKTQTVLAVWVGDDDISNSSSYSVKFSLVENVNKHEDDVIKLAINYNVIIHVSKSSHQPFIMRNDIPIVENNSILNFSVINTGNKYTKLSDYDIRFNRKHEENIVLTGESVASKGYDVFIPENQSIDIVLPSNLLPKSHYDTVTLIKRGY
ncbi:hypothetical protein C9J12_05435 [Photobacterium frigidiphilum]|uniref:Pili assembly chaperone N-terminal domain-containing protein n=1 Tax=Photobacterium frigidiphilum TaxID=264736 RepID=A0A2T3JMK4_9GAMM|nr:fimbria/pilus periplasmic chaperone [Photobacterium frigidiphilum]PSU50180.1 hypothetical protein C9J12_05435 [Photobacterium frigidiphilum]